MLPEFVERIPILKGWSEDRKFCAVKADGSRYLLRISPEERYPVRKKLFEMLRQVDDLEIPMCRPVQFGQCEEGVYILYTWIDGEDLEPALSKLSEQEQYALGVAVGGDSAENAQHSCSAGAGGLGCPLFQEGPGIHRKIPGLSIKVSWRYQTCGLFGEQLAATEESAPVLSARGLPCGQYDAGTRNASNH